MANHPSALKRNRQSIKRKARNRARKSEIHTLTKKVMNATAEEAPTLLKLLQSKIDKAARKGTLHWRTAARKISRLTRSLTKKSA